MLAENDPMKGYYDRVVQTYSEEDKQTMKNMILVFSAELGFTVEKYRQHCIENGYGSEESMKLLLP